jgi:hypothetical protein
MLKFELNFKAQKRKNTIFHEIMYMILADFCKQNVGFIMFCGIT